jgi:hypothetical protein
MSLLLVSIYGHWMQSVSIDLNFVRLVLDDSDAHLSGETPIDQYESHYRYICSSPKQPHARYMDQFAKILGCQSRLSEMVCGQLANQYRKLACSLGNLVR